MATAKKLPSGSYRVRIFDYRDEQNKPHYKSFTAPTKKEAERMASMYKYDPKKELYTFQELMEHYLDSKDNVLSPSTLRAYKCMEKVLLEKYPRFCKKKEITKDDVQELINDMAETKTPKTCKNYNAFISSVLGDSSHFKIKLPQQVKNIYKIPNKAEFKAILDDVKGTELEIPVLLGSFCMMRRSEICGLSLEDIEKDIIHIHSAAVKNKNNEYVSKTTKTVSSDRYIQAPQFIIDIIKEKGYVTNMTPAAISDAFHRVVVRLGINGMVFHGLRHWGASYRHSELNIPTAHIQRDGGWANAATLENIYRHALDDQHKEYSNRINNAFSDIFNDKK